MKNAAFILTAIFVLTALALPGCGKNTTTINIGRENLDLVAEGKTMTLDLTGIPSTGYEWTCEIDDENLLTEKSHETKEPQNDSSEPMVGTAVTEHYTFEAAGDGEVRLTTRYARSWETTPDDIEHVFVVTVKDGTITMVTEEGEPTPDEIMDAALSIPDSAMTISAK